MPNTPFRKRVTLARHADLALRQQQRRAADAKLELRRALEWAARLEGTLPSVVLDPPTAI